MAKGRPMSTNALSNLYSYTVCRHGPDSPQAHALRDEHASDEQFIAFADGFDHFIRGVDGSSIDYLPTEEDKMMDLQELTLRQLMGQLSFIAAKHGTHSNEVTAFIQEHTHVPEFPNLARQFIDLTDIVKPPGRDILDFN